VWRGFVWILASLVESGSLGWDGPTEHARDAMELATVGSFDSFGASECGWSRRGFVWMRTRGPGLTASVGSGWCALGSYGCLIVPSHGLSALRSAHVLGLRLRVTMTIHPGAEKEPAECGPRRVFLPEDEELVQKGGTVMGRQRNVNPLPVNLMFGGSMRPWESVSATGGGGSG
jgi:hypothetical protein